MGEQKTAPAARVERENSADSPPDSQPLPNGEVTLRPGGANGAVDTVIAHRLRAIVEQGRDLLALHAPSSRYLYVSPSSLAILGYPPEELIGADPSDYYHHDDRARLRHAVRDRVLAGFTQQTARYRFRRHDGSWAWLETLAVPLHEDPADPTRVTSVLSASRDVTAAVQAEEMLATSEQRLRVALMTAGLGLYDIELPRRSGYYSDEYLRIFGYGPEEREWFVAGWEPLVHPDDAAALAAGRERIRSGDSETFHLEARRMHRDGRWIWLRAQGRTFQKDVDGRPTRAVSTLNDIDKPRRDERLVRESRARLQQAQTIARLGDWRVDLPSMRQHWSDEAFRLLGYEPGECEPSTARFLARVHADDLPRVSRTFRAIEGDWKPTDEDMRLVLPGGVRHLHMQIRVVRTDTGVVRGLTGTLQDVTERRHAESALRTSAAELAQAQRIAQLGSWSWQQDANRLSLSPELRRILRVDLSSLDLAVVACERFFRPQSWQRLQAAVRDSIDQGQPYEVEVEFMRTDGSTGWGTARGEAARARPGRALRLFGTLQDITERKRGEIELREARDQVRELSSHREDELDQERKRIALDVHDEVGQMLTAMKLQLDILQSRIGNMRAVATSAERLRGLVEDTIEITRNVALSLRPAALDLGLVPALEWLAEDFTLRTETPCRVETTIGDVDLDEKASIELFRIAQESLTNIARHAGANEVWVSLQRIDGALCMRVRDDGCGFDAQRARALGHFGLLGMRERALRLGAQCHVQSRPGVGTTISVRLPPPAEPGARP